MPHLIYEGNDMISEAEDAATRDAVMIAGAQKAGNDEEEEERVGARGRKKKRRD